MRQTSQTLPHLIALAAGALLLLLLVAALLPEGQPAEEAAAPSPTIRAASATPKARLLIPDGPQLPTLAPSITPFAPPSSPQFEAAPPAVMVDRGGLSLRVVAPSATLLAGSLVPIQLELRNDSQLAIELLGAPGLRGPPGASTFGSAFQAQILTHTGEPVEHDERWYSTLSSGGNSELPPGASISQTIELYVPSGSTNQVYALWGSVRYLYRDQKGINRGIRQLDSGPLSLVLVPPAPDRQLVAELQVDGEAIAVQLREPEPAPAGLKGTLLLSGPTWSSEFGFAFDEAGHWSEPVSREHALPDQVRVLVSAPGYAAAVLTQTLREDPLAQPPVKTIYATREEARGHVPFDLVALEPLLPGSTLEAVEVLSQGLGLAEEISITQYYRVVVPESWDELTFVRLKQSKAGSVDFSDADYVEVALNGRTGYARLRYGRWALTWNNRSSVVTLDAGAGDFELEELVEVARKIAGPPILKP